MLCILVAQGVVQSLHYATNKNKFRPDFFLVDLQEKKFRFRVRG